MYTPAKRGRPLNRHEHDFNHLPFSLGTFDLGATHDTARLLLLVARLCQSYRAVGQGTMFKVYLQRIDDEVTP